MFFASPVLAAGSDKKNITKRPHTVDVDAEDAVDNGYNGEDEKNPSKKKSKKEIDRSDTTIQHHARLKSEGSAGE